MYGLVFRSLPPELQRRWVHSPQRSPAQTRSDAIPDGLSDWPAAANASEINALEGQTVSSGFIVPAGTNRSIPAYAFRWRSRVD